MGLRSSGLSTWSMVGQSSLAKAAEAASPFCLESEEKMRSKNRCRNITTFYIKISFFFPHQKHLQNIQNKINMLFLGHLLWSYDPAATPIYSIIRCSWLIVNMKSAPKNLSNISSSINIWSMESCGHPRWLCTTLCVEYEVIMLQRIHGAKCLEAYRPVNETSYNFPLHNGQPARSHFRSEESQADVRKWDHQ